MRKNLRKMGEKKVIIRKVFLEEGKSDNGGCYSVYFGKNPQNFFYQPLKNSSTFLFLPLHKK